jgi:hypothetical protein
MEENNFKCLFTRSCHNEAVKSVKPINKVEKKFGVIMRPFITSPVCYT